MLFLLLDWKLYQLLIWFFFFWKKMLNLSFLCYFFEACYKLRPILWFHLFVIKRKNRKKVIRLRPFLLSKDCRYLKGLYWLTKSVQNQRLLPLYLKISLEIFEINFFFKGLSLSKKYTHYQIIIQHKTSKNFLW